MVLSVPLFYQNIDPGLPFDTFLLGKTLVLDGDFIAGEYQVEIGETKTYIEFGALSDDRILNLPEYDDPKLFPGLQYVIARYGSPEDTFKLTVRPLFSTQSSKDVYSRDTMIVEWDGTRWVPVIQGFLNDSAVKRAVERSIGSLLIGSVSTLAADTDQNVDLSTLVRHIRTGSGWTTTRTVTFTNTPGNRLQFWFHNNSGQTVNLAGNVSLGASPYPLANGLSILMIESSGTMIRLAETAAGGGAGGDLNDLTDVEVPTPSDGQVLTWVGAASRWEAVTASAASVNVDQWDIAARLGAGNGTVSGVASGDLTGEGTPAAGDFLLGWLDTGELRKFDVGDLPFIANTAGLAALADVSAATPTANHAIIGNGSSFLSRALAATDIASGSFADGRVAQSNVTQHAGAINHDALLNFVADEHIDHTEVQVLAGTGLTGGGPINNDVTLDIANTAVTPGAYTLASITVDQQGRITAASSGTSTDGTGTIVATSSGALTVDYTLHEMTLGVILTTDQATSDFDIKADTPAGKMFFFAPGHATATVSVAGDAGSVNGTAGGLARLTNGGHAVARVVSNAGSAPVVVVFGDVILAPTNVNSTKTYANDDHGRTFVLISGAGTQTFNTAAASVPGGFQVMIVNTSGGNITIDGIDNDHTLANNGAVVVMKAGASLLAWGSAGVTVLDAA